MARRGEKPTRSKRSLRTQAMHKILRLIERAARYVGDLIARDRDPGERTRSVHRPSRPTGQTACRENLARRPRGSAVAPPWAAKAEGLMTDTRERRMTYDELGEGS
jgi:hypothetical protein